MNEIDGKIVLITGAAGGIGRAIATAFVAEGGKVVAVDIDAKALAPLEGLGALTVAADVTSQAAVNGAVEAAIDRFGRIDVLFNNAGLGGWSHPVHEIPEGELERVVAVHLFGGLYGLRAALPHMRAQGYGRVINTLSRGAETLSPNWGAYATAKAGLFALTRVAAAENADTDILINGLIPGPTRTGMWNSPDAQAPEAVVPCARWLATLPAGGPTGRVFWNMKEYQLFRPPEM